MLRGRRTYAIHIGNNIAQYYGIFKRIIIQDPNLIETYLTTLEANHIHLAKNNVILI